VEKPVVSIALFLDIQNSEVRRKNFPKLGCGGESVVMVTVDQKVPGSLFLIVMFEMGAETGKDKMPSRP